METKETAAERIARQSQVERSIEYFTLMGIQPTIEDVVLTSHILHKYIMNGWDSNIKELLQKLDKHLSDNYKGS